MDDPLHEVHLRNSSYIDKLSVAGSFCRPTPAVVMGKVGDAAVVGTVIPAAVRGCTFERTGALLSSDEESDDRSDSSRGGYLLDGFAISSRSERDRRSRSCPIAEALLCEAGMRISLKASTDRLPTFVCDRRSPTEALEPPWWLKGVQAPGKLADEGVEPE